MSTSSAVTAAALHPLSELLRIPAWTKAASSMPQPKAMQYLNTGLSTGIATVSVALSI